jgi:hypothetical protein
MKAVESACTIFTGRLSAQLANRSPFKLTAPIKRRIEFNKDEQIHVDHNNDDIDSIQDSASA